ncbi:divergent PAP2 family protein [soil metagenome]
MDALSPYIWAIIVAWTSAHIVKYIIAIARGNQKKFTRQVFISGGMPSSHVATAMALWVVILLIDGPGSGLFGLATLFALVVGHDAVRVRRSSGEQGEALLTVMNETNSKAKIPYIAKGHTLAEIAVGAIFGAAIGIVVFLVTT